MRGLHWVYLCAPFDVEGLAAALEVACEGQALRADESWLGRKVPRLIIQFQVEYRIAEREGMVSLIHRVTASDEVRERSRARLESVLRSWVNSGSGAGPQRA